MNVIVEHPAIFAILGYWVFSSLVGGMPIPDSTSSKGYQWLHDSLHILAGNLNAAVAAKYPNLTSGTVQVTDTVQKTTTVVPASNGTEVKP